MQMDTKMDTGDIVGQVGIPVEENDTQSTVLNKIPSYAIDLIRKHVKQLGQEAYTQQDESQATYTRKLKREDGYVELSVLQKLLHQERLNVRTLPIISEYYGKNPSYTLPEYITQDNLFQFWKGLHPWPGVWTLMQTTEGEKRLKIIGMQIVDGKPAITQVQVEGRNVVSLREFQDVHPTIFFV